MISTSIVLPEGTTVIIDGATPTEYIDKLQRLSETRPARFKGPAGEVDAIVWLREVQGNHPNDEQRLNVEGYLETDRGLAVIRTGSINPDDILLHGQPQNPAHTIQVRLGANLSQIGVMQYAASPYNIEELNQFGWRAYRISLLMKL